MTGPSVSDTAVRGANVIHTHIGTYVLTPPFESIEAFWQKNT